MLWKIYFFIIGFVILFSAYYKLVVTSFGILDLINVVVELILLVGAYSYIFQKKLLSSKNWQLVFKGLLIFVGFNILYQIWPSNYVGNFSLLNGALWTNIFAYLFVLVFYLPLYYAVYQLSLAGKKKAKRS